MEFTIKYFDKESEVDHDGCKPLVGQIVYTKNEIRLLKSTRSKTAINQTLWHEILHGIIEFEHIDDLSEYNIDRMANALNTIADIRGNK